MVLATSTRYKRYDPVVLTTNFLVTYPMFNSADIEVRVDSVITTAFTTTGTFVNGKSDDFTVILDTAANGVPVELYGKRAPRRDNDHLAGSPDLPANLQVDIEAVTAVQQENQRDVDRTLLFPVDLGASFEITENAAARAGKNLSFDSAGNPTVLLPDAAAAAASAATVAGQANVTDLAQIYPTTTGTNTAYVLSSGTSQTSFPTGVPFWARFHLESGASPTLDLDGLGAKAIHGQRREPADVGVLVAGQIKSNAPVLLRYNGTKFIALAGTVDREEIERVVKSADEARSSDVGTTVDNELSLVLSEIGMYEVSIGIYHAAGAGAFKFRINKPTNSVLILERSKTDVEYNGDSNLTDPDTSGSRVITRFVGTLRNTESAAIQLGWGQNSSNAAATTVQQDSYIHCKYLGS